MFTRPSMDQNMGISKPFETKKRGKRWPTLGKLEQ